MNLERQQTQTMNVVANIVLATNVKNGHTKKDLVILETIEEQKLQKKKKTFKKEFGYVKRKFR